MYSISAETDVIVGNTMIKTDGLTIEGGPSITSSGMNAGSKAVVNVSDGVQNSDAVNMGQLAQYLGGGAGYSNITEAFESPTYSIGHGENISQHHNVGDALNALNNADLALSNRVDNLGDQLQQAFYSTNKRIDDVEKKPMQALLQP